MKRPAAALLGGGFVALAAVAVAWTLLDRRPPEWDHANHLETALHCARGLGTGDVARVLGESPFYPPLVPCAAGALFLVMSSETAAGLAVMLGFLGLGMLATYLLGRRLVGESAGTLAALLYGSAPFVVFSTVRFQLDLPLAAMVALALLVFLEADGLRRAGPAVLAGAVVGLGLMVKPPFAVYVAPALGWLLRDVRQRRGAVKGLLLLVTAAAVALPWYGARVLALPSQFAARGTSAAETVHQDPASWQGLLQYLVWLPMQFGVVATALTALGLIVAVRRRAAWLLASLLAPFLVFEALRNKNLRYTLPLLPVAAVVAAMGWRALSARARIVVVALAGGVAVIQVSATLFDRPHAARVPGLGVPLGVASPPERGDWRQGEILDLIARDSGGRPVTVSVVPNHPFFSTSNFRLRAVRETRPLEVTRAWVGEPLGIEYMILKTGDVGPPWTEPRIRRIMRRLADDRDLARVFPAIGEFLLPDGSVASVRARRLGDGVMAAPAAVAAGLERAVWSRVGEVARELEAPRLSLGHGQALRRGEVARAELSAASATFAEFRRPGAARLRVRDVRVHLEDVLVDPASALEGRLLPLDVGRVRVSRATITAEDLQAFLAGLPKFPVRVGLEAGAFAVRVPQPGPDFSATVRVVPAAGRPFGVLAERVRVGPVPVPAPLVDWVVRHYDPSGRIARRLPVAAALGRVVVSPDAVRIVDD